MSRVLFVMLHPGFVRYYDDALYTAATHASNEQYIDSVCALFADVVGITRLALDQKEGTTS